MNGGDFLEANGIAYPNLRAEMGRKNINIQTLADTCGVTRDSLSRKLSRKSRIALDEAFVIQRKAFPECDFKYLFATEDTAQNQRDRPA